VPTCLNLAHCYNQTHNYHFAIKYASQVLDQDDSSTRALFRRGSAYSEIGEFERARADLELALSFVKQTDEKVALLEALDRLRDLENKSLKRPLKSFKSGQDLQSSLSVLQDVSQSEQQGD
jgi:tetratricopeptide (TPR) repeat protein